MKTPSLIWMLVGLIGLYMVIRYGGSEIAPTLSGVAFILMALANNTKN